jgi:hypothetical protein
MQRDALDRRRREPARQPVGADLRPREDQHRPFGRRRCSISQSSFAPLARLRAVRDRLGRLLRSPTCTNFGSRTISSANRTTSSGIVAEKSSVCRVAGSARDDPAHVGPEAHVHHPVGFVEHEQLDAARSAFCCRM